MQTPHRTRIYNKEQIELAKELYLQYKPTLEICMSTGLSTYAVKYYVRTQWRKERELHRNQAIELLGEAKAKAFAEIGMHGMDLLVKSLKEHVRSGTILTIKESFALSNILTNIDKIVRLDQGAPTDIVKDIQPADRGEIIELVQADPFYRKLPQGSNND